MFKRSLILFGALLMSLSMWIWVQSIVVPHQAAESAKLGRPRGNLSDLYPRWWGARELLLHGRDPYRTDITREIQIGYYGRPLDPTLPNDPKDQQGFAYPIYVVLLLAPTVTLSFTTVHRIAFWLLAALTAVSVPLWLRMLGWRVSKVSLVAWVLLTLSCFPSIQGLKLQQLTLLVAALIAGSMYALSRQWYLVAGIFLALATIKPQLVFLLILWVCIWVVGNWRQRQRLWWSFGVSMLVLVIAGELLLPGWITEFRGAMKDYFRYTGGGLSMLDVAFSSVGGKLVAAIVFAVLLVFCWRNRGCGRETAAFHWTVCFTLATTLLIIPSYAVYNQLVLLPAAMMALRSGGQLWERGLFLRFFYSITASAIFWPFVSAAGLVIALAVMPGYTVQKAWGLPALYPSFAIPVTIYALLLVARDVVANEPRRVLQLPSSRRC
ncbi:MAG TPA: glycosyltransferase family 87 protein [Candidatus Sulfotelmatobacter sp.]|nr:glycosyltransferase family 87 protein [Candidatus Sulfotelmatobacter sp.]